MELRELKKVYSDFAQLYPNCMWAKKFDQVIHIPVAGSSGGTQCGSVAARLGNNYAPAIVGSPICPKCLKVIYNSIEILQFKMDTYKAIKTILDKNLLADDQELRDRLSQLNVDLYEQLIKLSTPYSK